VKRWRVRHNRIGKGCTVSSASFEERPLTTFSPLIAPREDEPVNILGPAAFSSKRILLNPFLKRESCFEDKELPKAIYDASFHGDSSIHRLSATLFEWKKNSLGQRGNLLGILLTEKNNDIGMTRNEVDPNKVSFHSPNSISIKVDGGVVIAPVVHADTHTRVFNWGKEERGRCGAGVPVWPLSVAGVAPVAKVLRSVAKEATKNLACEGGEYVMWSQLPLKRRSFSGGNTRLSRGTSRGTSTSRRTSRAGCAARRSRRRLHFRPASPRFSTSF